MKQLLLLIALGMMTFAMSAQEESRWPDVDKSIMDAVTYPTVAQWRNYSTGAERTIEPKLRVVYSRPMKKGRDIFGGLVPYGTEWRLGANEASTITFYTPVRIGETSVLAGTYTIVATPERDNWTFHISSQSGIWGNANRDESLTVASLKVPSKDMKDVREELSMTFQKIDDNEVHLVVAWENKQASLPIHFNPIFFRPIDVSPMDITHYPAKSAYTNYLEGDEKNMKHQITVQYSRPAKKGRDIFGELLKEGDIWRIGANESTEITFMQNVMISGIEIPRGRYAMYAELHTDKWELIFSKDLPSWGNVNRDMVQDFARVSIPVTQEDEVVENLSIVLEDGDTGMVNMVIAWDTTRATASIKLRNDN